MYLYKGLACVRPGYERLGREWLDVKATSSGENAWQEGVLYKQHPFKRGQYIPLDAFHDYIANEKVKEFIDIMIGLGAKSIHYRKSKIMRGKEKIEVSAKKRFLPGDLTVTGETYQEAVRSYEVDLEMEKPPGPVPVFRPEEREYVWYPSQPGWDSIIESRMKNPSIARLEVALVRIVLLQI